MSVNTGAAFSSAFSGGQHLGGGQHTLREGDPEVIQIWKDYSDATVDKNGWPFRQRALAALKRLVSAADNFFLRQDRNPYLHNYNYEFLLDTLGFVATGHRRISIYTWPDMLTFQPETRRTESGPRRAITDLYRQHELSPDINELIQRWVNQPKGFDDLVYSLNIMFGDLPQKFKSE